MADILANVYARVLWDHAQGDLLDLGCGKVPMYGMYERWVDTVTCVDWTNSPHDSPYIDCVADLNRPLPLRSERFDTVLLADVLEHIAEPERLLAEVLRVLRPHGKLILGVPFMYWIHEAPFDYYRYTEFALRRYCDLLGMRVISLASYGSAREATVDLLAKQVQPSAILSSIVLAIGKVVCASDASRRTSKVGGCVPLGYLLVAEKNG